MAKMVAPCGLSVIVFHCKKLDCECTRTKDDRIRSYESRAMDSDRESTRDAWKAYRNAVAVCCGCDERTSST